MASQYEKTGADKVYGVAINHTLANLLSMLGACMWAVANDKQAWVFSDKDGNILKSLTDASGGSSQIPDKSVIIADSNGHATSSTKLKFDDSTSKLICSNPFTLLFGAEDVDGSVKIIIENGFMFWKRIDGTWIELAILN